MGPAPSPDGHPEPYRLKYLELGNEEAVDEAYWRRFKPLAEAIWAKDREIVPIVGDFEYKRPITDPDHFDGAPRIKSLAAHKKILDLAKAHGREVWFDVHIWNHNPREARAPIAALATLRRGAGAARAPGADFRLCVLEENATNHAVRRAVAHGETINGLIRMGDRVRIVLRGQCPAAGRPKRQRLGPGPAVPRRIADLGATAVLYHTNDLKKLSVTVPRCRRREPWRRARRDGTNRRGRDIAPGRQHG